MDALEEVENRKRLLLERSEQERNDIARTYYQWQARSNVARQTLGFLRHPLVLSGLGLIAWRMPWRRALRFGGWGLKAWRLVRLARRFWL